MCRITRIRVMARALQCLKRHPRLEGRGMIASRSSHGISFRYRNVQQISHLSACPKIPSHLSDPHDMKDEDGMLFCTMSPLVSRISVENRASKLVVSRSKVAPAQ